MRVRLSSVLLAAGAAVGGAALLGAIALYEGFYNVAATHQHLRPTYWVLDFGLRRSIRNGARDIAVPPLDDPALGQRGLQLYAAHCLQCHGAPGVAPQPFALGLTPLPSNLAESARRLSPAELYWVVRNGIKMTAMPAWEFRFSDADLWAVVAFVEQLPLLAPAQYAERARARPERHTHAETAAPRDATGRLIGDPRRGKIALRQYGCASCHAIPGIVGADAPVGPPLDRIATREVLAGVLPNTPQNMLRWLRAPQEVAPLSAMPDVGVTERAAADMAAYLDTLR